VTTRFADLTTLRVGGPVGTLVDAESEADLIDAIRSADASGTPLLVLGGGSNLLAADAAFEGVVVRDRRARIDIASQDGCGGAAFTVTAGTPWEEVVEAAVTHGWSGLEALTGIPGSTGATPVQNVGAYGQEVAETIAAVRCWDRVEGRVRTFATGELGFGYRTSLLKRTIGDLGPTPRYVVLSVSFHTRLATLSGPVRYAELARTLGVELGQRVAMAEARQAVLGLRRAKGMVLEATDHDTWSAGSFFTNPIVAPDLVPAGAPTYPVDTHGGPERIKTSAAWLISGAGLGRGFTLGTPAALSSKHVLALTNRGGASAADILGLARHVREVVRRAYGITLVPEPVLVGLTL